MQILLGAVFSVSLASIAYDVFGVRFPVLQSCILKPLTLLPAIFLTGTLTPQPAAAVLIALELCAPKFELDLGEDIDGVEVTNPFVSVNIFSAYATCGHNISTSLEAIQLGKSSPPWLSVPMSSRISVLVIHPTLVSGTFQVILAFVELYDCSDDQHVWESQLWFVRS